MPMSRRTFVHHTLAAGPIAMRFWIDADVIGRQGDPQCALPTPQKAIRFIPNEPRVVDRVAVGALADPANAAQLATFRRAFDIIRNLAPVDVISWQKQVAQHCLNCAPANAKNINYDWQFLPWHRGLLYFFERILRNLSRQDDFRLAYWDWESSGSRSLPAIYGQPAQSLYWRNRNVTGPDWPLSDSAVDVQPLLSLPAFRLFGGTATQQRPVPASFTGPHAVVHNAFSPGDMADLQMSPRDPVFYAHHSNIDRLWSSWATIRGHLNPNFADVQVYFYDETRQWRFVLMGDLVDERRLGYRYSSLMQPAVPPSTLRTFALTKRGVQFALSVEGKALARRVTGPHFLLLENVTSLAALAPDAREFAIFSGNPETGIVALDAKGFLGKFARVLSGDHTHYVPLSATINVTGRLPAAISVSADTLALSITALDTAGRTSGRAVPLEAEAISLLG